MGKYFVEVKATAKKELAAIKDSGNTSDIEIIEKIFAEFEIHPFSGLGNPTQLNGKLPGFWARSINNNDQLIYNVDGMRSMVCVVSAKGHYYKGFINSDILLKEQNITK